MKTFVNPEKSRWSQILQRPLMDVSGLYETVQGVLNEIKQKGDSALRKYTLQFDGVDLEKLQVSEEEWTEAERQVEPELKKAIELAANNIEKFHGAQKTEIRKVETMPGVSCWQKAVPIEKVGLYIPGGTAPLFSTVLMLAIPARIAGCREIVLCTPPGKDGSVHPAILFAAKYSGVKKVFKLGGVQAIGAMAYGTESVPKADKIFGPGNQYVMAAKQLVSINEVAIDMPAGPSEVMVVADKSADPAFIASDLLSQAEHGADSQVVLVTNNEELAEQVKAQINLQLEKLPRKELAEKSLKNSVLIVMEDEQKIVNLINEYAPEHLILSTKNYSELAERVFNAGSVFLGNYTPESAGDYASGTNHTLPTNGWARSYSGVNLDSFIKKITFQEITEEGLKSIGPAIETMAAAEQLEAHKNAVTLRLKRILLDEG
ncbi:histidinol dehydrogenase [Mariniphaga sediminis]|uniref:Histidinol dehydrogenase n=1 Tax=Mariniphaga sediminis TaxID=1628158 RepID=A0A399CUA3_9BACT|nr:histidinol dehydrogenase [Mariniphaga sediminis]RIH62913.1 histidinol dehydrogenase [Mariniphaga sediminis]